MTETVSAPAETTKDENTPAHRHKFRPYAMALLSPTDNGLRRRSGSDVARLVIALLVLVAMGFSYGASTNIFGPVAGWIRPLPHLLGWLFTTLWFVGSLGVIVLMVCVIAIAHRFEILRDLVVATVLSWLGCVAIQQSLGVRLGLPHGSELTFKGIDLGFPAVLLAITAGICLVAGPYLSRSLQRLVEINLALMVITGFVHGAGLPFSLVAAVALGWGAAALTHLLFGRPIPVPTADEVAGLLEELKITAGSVRAVPYQQWGLTRFVAPDDAGRTLRISLYSRDARQSQLFAKVYRSLVYRRDVGPFALTRVQQIEHEAYLTLLAQRAAPGSTAELVTTAVEGPSKEALVVSASPDGPLLHELSDAGRAPSAAAISSLAGTVKLLHDQRIAHGSIDYDHVVVEGDHAGLVNFDRGVGNADSEALNRDVAALLVTASLATNADIAVPAVTSELGSSSVSDALPFLQDAALSPTLTAALRGSKHRGFLKEVRQKGADAAGVPVPEVAQMGRFSWSKVLLAGGSLLGVWAIVGVLLNAAHSASTIGQADLPWVVVTALISLLTAVGWAYAALGTIPGALPLWPLILLELSNTFSSLTVTGAVTATRIRFFQRQGMDATTAVGSQVLGGVA